MTAKPLFAEWSAQSAKNVPDYTAKAWAGFQPPLDRRRHHLPSRDGQRLVAGAGPDP